MNVARIPPGGVAFAHIHVDFEVMLYILEGTVRHDFGPNLRHSIVNHAGDFIFIEPGVPHEVYNDSDTEDVVAVVARSDASEWENIVDYDRETGKVIPKRGASGDSSASRTAITTFQLKRFRPKRDSMSCYHSYTCIRIPQYRQPPPAPSP